MQNGDKPEVKFETSTRPMKCVNFFRGISIWKELFARHLIFNLLRILNSFKRFSRRKHPSSETLSDFATPSVGTYYTDNQSIAKLCKPSLRFQPIRYFFGKILFEFDSRTSTIAKSRSSSFGILKPIKSLFQSIRQSKINLIESEIFERETFHVLLDNKPLSILLLNVWPKLRNWRNKWDARLFLFHSH